MRRDFEGGVYWDELADKCGDISRAAGFRGAATFRGNTVSKERKWNIKQYKHRLCHHLNESSHLVQV